MTRDRDTLVGLDADTDPPPRPRLHAVRLDLEEEVQLTVGQVEALVDDARENKIWRERVFAPFRVDVLKTLERIELGMLTSIALTTDDRERIARAERTARAAMEKDARTSKAEQALMDLGLDVARNRLSFSQKISQLAVKHGGQAIKTLVTGLVTLALAYLALRFGVKP